VTLQTPATGEPQAGSDGAPQAGEGTGSPQPQDGTTAGESQQPQGGTGTAEEGDLPEPVREMLRNYRQENRSLRERLRALEQQGKPQAGEPQVAELQRTVEAQQARLRLGEVRYAVAVASGKLGIVDPEAAYRLLEPEDIDYDERDKPQNVERLLTDLTRERPWLKGSPAARGGSDGGAGQSPKAGARSMNDALREATGRGRR